MSDARGGIVVGWLFKIVLGLAFFALVAFETGAIVVAKVTADRVAINAADEAGQVYESTGSSAKAEDAAKKVAEQEDTAVVKFRIINGGRDVEVTVRKIASTLIVKHIGGIRKFAIEDSTHIGSVR
jgi:membrane-associated protease RseP (regulator of RpoE activity)